MRVCGGALASLESMSSGEPGGNGRATPCQHAEATGGLQAAALWCRAAGGDVWEKLAARSSPGSGDLEGDEGPALPELVERLEKHSGMSVAEVVAVVQAPWSKFHGPLHMAAAAGKVEACKYLIEKLELDVNAAGTDGARPLHFAVHSSGSLAVVKLLLDHKADPNRVCCYGCAPVHIAVIRGSYYAYEIAEELLSRGANVDLSWEYKTPLYIAAQWGDTKMMELLLRHEAHPNNVMQHAPLKAAILARSLIVVELLIKARAGVNFSLPETPLTAAAAAGLTEFVKRLLRAGADANIPDGSGRIAVELLQSMDGRNVLRFFSLSRPLRLELQTGASME